MKGKINKIFFPPDRNDPTDEKHFLTHGYFNCHNEFNYAIL